MTSRMIDLIASSTSKLFFKSQTGHLIIETFQLLPLRSTSRRFDRCWCKLPMDWRSFRNGAGSAYKWIGVKIDFNYLITRSHKNSFSDRTVYFHALASTKEFSVPNTVLKNETLATSNDAYYAYTLLGDRGPKSQATAEFYDDKTDVIFYTQINRDAIGCWNIKKPYTPENQGLVDSDSDALVFPNDLKVDRDGKLYVLSDRMPLFLYGSLKPEYNYRILTGRTSEIISGTACA